MPTTTCNEQVLVISRDLVHGEQLRLKMKEVLFDSRKSLSGSAALYWQWSHFFQACVFLPAICKLIYFGSSVIKTFLSVYTMPEVPHCVFLP